MPPCLQRVERETHLSATGPFCVYAQNPTYTRADGVELIESIKHEALAFDSRGTKHYYHTRIFRRLSPDNGATWQAQEDFHQESAARRGGVKRHTPMHLLDAARDCLISVFTQYEVDPEEPMFQPRNRMLRTRRLCYELSFDGGRSWTQPRPVIDHRPGHDAVRWAPHVRYGESGVAADLCAHTWLDDGTLVLGATLSPAPDSYPPDDPRRHSAVVYFQAWPSDEGDDLIWRCGEPVRLAHEDAPHGSAEPSIVLLGGRTIFNVMRCQGNAESNIPSRRWTTVSPDGGLTWEKPALLRYDDGEPVHTPASQSQFLVDGRTGRIYWLANILPEPVFAQMPRYPLTLAEFDPERRCIIRDSISVIQDLPPGAPKERRYTNWGAYQDRETGQFVVTLPEMPRDVDFSAMTDPDQMVGDCLRYRLTLHQAKA